MTNWMAVPETTFAWERHRQPRQSIPTRPQPAKEAPKGHGETVLVVEDEVSILLLARKLLENLGYAVLMASSPLEAESLAKEHSGGIHLLLTDVVMPGINGRDLAERLKEHYPSLRVLFMSGYTADVIAHRGVLDSGLNFIQKPFSRLELALKVREAITGDQ